jgi:hypothetical protein
MEIGDAMKVALATQAGDNRVRADGEMKDRSPDVQPFQNPPMRLAQALLLYVGFANKHDLDFSKLDLEGPFPLVDHAISDYLRPYKKTNLATRNDFCHCALCQQLSTLKPSTYRHLLSQNCLLER